MKAVIPAAGRGTRLYPQTHTKPKAMVRIAGKPILGHILENLKPTEIDDVVLVVGGPMQEQIVEYVESAFSDTFSFDFVEQEDPEGLGHSIYQAKPVVEEEPVFIALGDMLFENGYTSFLDAHRELRDPDASIGVKRVSDPRHYGVVEFGDDGWVKQLVEKPADPPSDYAISGVYVVEDSVALFDALGDLIENDVRGAGDEYQLTDALQRMVERGNDIGVFEVEDWYDCGRPQTLLEANEVLLSKLSTNDPTERENCVLIPPVDFGDDVTISNAVIGPNVSVDSGTEIEGSIVQDAIIGEESTLSGVNIEESIVGDRADVAGSANRLNVGDSSTLHL